MPWLAATWTTATPSYMAKLYMNFGVCKVFKILSVVSSLKLLGILVLQIIWKLCIGFLWSIAFSLNYVLLPTKPECHHISVLYYSIFLFSLLYHIHDIVLLLVQGEVTCLIHFLTTYYFDYSMYRVHKS